MGLYMPTFNLQGLDYYNIICLQPVDKVDSLIDNQSVILLSREVILQYNIVNRAYCFKIVS